MQSFEYTIKISFCRNLWMAVIPVSSPHLTGIPCGRRDARAICLVTSQMMTSSCVSRFWN